MVQLVKVETFINGDLAKATGIAGKLASRAISVDKQGDTALATQIRQLADRYYKAIEANIALATGSKKISEQSGKGLQVDLLKFNASSSTYETSEIKGSFIKTYVRELKTGKAFSAVRTREIDLGSTLKIGYGGQSRLTIGYSRGATENIVEEVQELKETERFAEYYKGNLELLREHLINPSEQQDPLFRDILSAVSKNLETKALTLRLPFYINKQKVAVTTLQFKRDYILKNADLRYVASASGGTIDINFSYKQSIINEGLKLATSSPELSSAVSEFDDKFANYINNSIAKIDKNPKKLDYFANLITNIEKRLNNKSFTADITYVEGSVMAYIGRVKVQGSRKTKKKRDVAQQPSIVRLTELVQGRVRLKMRRGLGEPRPSKIYERSGTFRSSIDVFADFRTRQINYFYLPYYDSLEEYGYEVNSLVTESIRAIMQERYATQFQLRRRLN